ncbi:MAG TPA: phosphate ABC transporter, permease protein PstA, partial [Chloroflexia bacterium]|nr:phosphate ABC transporter, permease protein PstA [Chloroflexia bacterium]
MSVTDTTARERGAAPHVSRLFKPNIAARKARGYIFGALGILSILIGLGVLVTLILDVLVRGLPWLDWQFLTSFDSRFPARAGIKAALYGTAFMMFFTILISLPLGIMSAVYLEQYATDSRLNRFIELNISNLAGVPSIIYGLLGLQVFVRWFALERSVIAGALTMALLVVPTIIVASREAIR